MKKILVSFICILPLVLSAQITSMSTVQYTDSRLKNCSKLCNIDEDGVKIGSKEKVIISDNGIYGFQLTIWKLGAEPSLDFLVSGANKCITKYNYIYIGFNNGKKFEFKNNGVTNCDGKFVLNINSEFGKKELLALLQTQEIDYIKIEAETGFVEKKLTPAQSLLIQEIMYCLMH